jgi:hypothetical protein
MVTILSARIKQQQQADSNRVLKALLGLQCFAFAAFFGVYTCPRDKTTTDTINNSIRSISHHRSMATSTTEEDGPPSSFKLLPAITNSRAPDAPWPELSEFYNGKDVIKDPQFLLDFAIIGFEKSGSSTFMKWLGAHPQIQCFQEEIYDMYLGKVGTMVWRLYTQLKPGFQYKRGYKSPGDIFLANTIHLLDEYFPKTRLILSLRHPVLYYQSIYNCKW